MNVTVSNFFLNFFYYFNQNVCTPFQKCVSPVVVGNHDAVVVHADNSAVDFFRKFGFSDDVILNSKWR